MGDRNDLAVALHVQRLQRALDLTGFIQQIKKSKEDLDSCADTDWEGTYNELAGVPSEQTESSDGDTIDSAPDRTPPSDNDGPWWLSGAGLSRSRRRLAEDLLGSSDDEFWDNDDECERPLNQLDLARMLQQHRMQRKLSRQYRVHPVSSGHLYYSAGLLSEHDRHPSATLSPSADLAERPPSSTGPLGGDAEEPGLLSVDPALDLELTDLGGDRSDGRPYGAKKSRSSSDGQRRIKRAIKQERDTMKALATQRRKLWLYVSKKEVGKVQRSMVNGRKDKLVILKRLATGCMRACRQKALQSQKLEKDVTSKMKRLTREMQSYWKHYNRVEKETRKRLEKQEIEQKKISSELLEAKRQQRKLNFLITQTELYAHFIGPKSAGRCQEAILGHLDEGKTDVRLAAIDDYDSEAAKMLALQNARAAAERSRQYVAQFEHTPGGAAADDTTGATGNAPVKTERLSPLPEVSGNQPEQLGATETSDYPQPSLFKGHLKSYQLKGMNWIANLFDSGINGILADEMGLGKTVQTIAFLAHLAEHYGIWGPFLIVSPASTLHNWQQELARFLPAFKVVPYWGNTQDRKVLRTFWEQANLHTEEASFHVVVTSYQLVVSDIKYFSRIDWQCMVLDEAQAIKSTNSQRWKNLLGFKCRSRILLTGTPIQNSMAELWALLHFIMPSLFDSHREFNDWFSRDIENHAENRVKGDIDETHLSRLHMILKPFMLRRVKRDVENELTDKIEVMVYCPLTIRQRLLYQGLKKTSIDELLRSAQGGGQYSQVTTSLLNLVMQFRKVCNHPELFERRDVYSPFLVRLPAFQLPRLVFREALLHRSQRSVQHVLYNKLNVFTGEHVHRSLDTVTLTDGELRCSSTFSFLRFVDQSAGELCAAASDPVRRWRLLRAALEAAERRRRQPTLPGRRLGRHALLLDGPCDGLQRPSSLIFTSHTAQFYAHVTHRLECRPETLEHRMLRTRKTAGEPTAQATTSLVPVETRTTAGSKSVEKKLQLLPEFRHRPRPAEVLLMQPTDLPAFLQQTPRKAMACPLELYCSDRSAAWWWDDYLHCGSPEGRDVLLFGSPEGAVEERQRSHRLTTVESGGLSPLRPPHGWSQLIIPDKRTLITDAGKLYVLDSLLKKLKDGGHRVLIYSQMTRMIDLLEEYMFYRHHKYSRLDGSSKISERRDMVEDFQTRSDIFVFLLSTRAGGLGINLTAADTVIFYDSDWNPTVDQQAMDRAHRLGQTRQVTVYRLISKGTIEERILERAREKNEIQRMVISGGNFRPDRLNAKEVVSLLLGDDVIEKNFRARQAESQQERKRRADQPSSSGSEKRSRTDQEDLSQLSSPLDSRPASRATSEWSAEGGGGPEGREETSPEGSLMVDMDITPLPSPGGPPASFLELHQPRRKRGTGRKRGRPRGSTSRGRGRGRGGHSSVPPPPPAPPAPSQTPTRRGRGRPRLVPGAPVQSSRPPIKLTVPLASSRYFQEKQQREGGAGAPGPSGLNRYSWDS
ncbi:chromatin-remodeling ATPase INO80-like [Amphibalanus amphitrite]|uniref:chromatin-remodeling ATPase INO80-like n=1 Tax=Amphibalanus amphitrite TaxID=1232801 RepID=UPI001C8FF49B|nr:chromatin-remodeling ATPase INO80-like [Amphibalanus amphitrite]